MLTGLDHGEEWLKQERAVWDEGVVVINHTQEFFEFALGGWLWELLNGFTLCMEWSDACWSYSVAEEGERGNTELRLVHINLYAIVLQASEGLVKVLSV